MVIVVEPRRLALSPMHLDDDTVPLAPWCYLGHEQRAPDWETRSFAAAVGDHAEWLTQCTTARHLAWDLAEDLAPTLNLRHGCDYPLRYWRILLMPWLMAFSQMAWKRCLELRVCAANADQTFTVPVWTAEPTWDFVDTADFYHRGLFRPEFNLWVSSCLAVALDFPHWTLVKCDPPPPPPPPEAATGRAGLVPRVIGGLLGRVRFDNVIGASPLASALFSMLLSVLPPSRTGSLAPVGKPFSGRAPVPGPLYAAILDMALRCMPQRYGRFFAAADQKARSLRYRKGKLLLKGGVLMFNDSAIFEVAHADLAGEKIFGVQHGSMYGTAMTVPDLGEIEYRHHGLITWGWSKQTGHPVHTVPLAAPLLSKFSRRHRQRSPDLLLVGTQMRLLNTRFDSAPQAHQVAAYRRAKLAFVTQLASAPRAALVYRPGQPDPVSIEDAPYLCRYAGQIPEATGSLHPRLLSCRLLVLDHPGTTLNIALAANVPTVLFWNPDHWPMAPEAAKSFEGLVSAGILHYDATAAARHVNDVFDEVAGWWRGPPVQEARLHWCRHYARASRLWPLQWIRALTGE